MKQIKRVSAWVKRHPKLATVATMMAAGLGATLVGDDPAASSAAVPVAASSVSRWASSPDTVSPFDAMPASAKPAVVAATAPAAVAPLGLSTASSIDTTTAATSASAGISANNLIAAADTSTASTPQVIAPPGMQAVQPPHLYVMSVPTPSDVDADGQNASASLPAAQVQVPTDSVTRHAAAGGVTASSGEGAVSSVSNVNGMTPAAATTTVAVYTPAQIRQAYGFAALPAGTTANKSAYQGSGQIIVIVDAYHGATTGADLNTFSAKFGLPACTLVPTTYKAGTAISALVSKPAAGDGCSFQVLYANSAGAQAATAPAVDSSWATEIALDVQWVHAIAPMAKIVLVEAASSGGGDLMNAMVFASKLGGSAVSMSFGTAEFASGPSYDSIMSGVGITWVAASGDDGTGVSWPASSKNALGVGGTLLGNVSPRAETGWAGSGGGRSAYVAMPPWQSGVTVPGNPANTTANASKMRRGVPDVAYNASPYSGFYVYLTGKGYLSVGGTSAGTPQWAALVSIIDGVRALNGKAAFGGTSFQEALYGTAASAANYKASLLDVTAGSNGTCATCSALTSYDLVTGLGTPNVVSLVNTMVTLK